MVKDDKNKKSFVVRISKKLDEEFRFIVRSQNKQLNLSLEEAIKLWIVENK